MISATPGREVRQELYLNTQYEKARQDVGLFLLPKGLPNNPNYIKFRKIQEYYFHLKSFFLKIDLITNPQI